MNWLRWPRIVFLATISCALLPRCVLAADADSWQEMFNGKDLAGWIVEGSKDYKDGEEQKPVWTVKDGMIACAGKGFGFLRYDKEYKDFVFQVEYRMSKGCNSGLGIRTVKFTGPAKTRPSYASYEIQILDDAGKPPAKGSSGSLYRYVAAKVNATKPAPDWNTMEIECRGPKIRITLNGQVIQDVDQSTIDEIKNKPLSGYLCLQNHGKFIEFRKLRVKAL
jgi:hypothetical protein